MLCDENRMTAEWCLLTIVCGLRRSEPARNKVVRVLENERHSFRCEVFALFDTKRKCAAECRPRQRIEYLTQISHSAASNQQRLIAGHYLDIENKNGVTGNRSVSRGAVAEV